VTPGDAPGLPVLISLPGSYRLTSNLLVRDADVTAENRTAILIDSVDVTLDLNGFSILGKTVCDSGGICNPTGTGVGIDGRGAEGVEVHNGTVEGMGNAGILLGSRATLRRLRAAGNGGSGLEAGAALCCTRARSMYNVHNFGARPVAREERERCESKKKVGRSAAVRAAGVCGSGDR